METTARKKGAHKKAVHSKTACKIFPTLEREAELFAGGADLVIGFDEVGRGALAGPVMVGAAALTGWAGREVPAGLADSKMLTEQMREALFDSLAVWPDAWAVGAASNREIDEWGISHALGIAALRALEQVEAKLTEAASSASFAAPYAILDGPHDYITVAASSLQAPRLGFLPRVTTRVKADAACASVAAASVLAKVTRDRLMESFAPEPSYAPYGWAANKGYGTKAHRAAIAENGPSDLHRLTWHLV